MGAMRRQAKGRGTPISPIASLFVLVLAFSCVSAMSASAAAGSEAAPRPPWIVPDPYTLGPVLDLTPLAAPIFPNYPAVWGRFLPAPPGGGAWDDVVIWYHKHDGRVFLIGQRYVLPDGTRINLARFPRERGYFQPRRPPPVIMEFFSGAVYQNWQSWDLIRWEEMWGPRRLDPVTNELYWGISLYLYADSVVEGSDADSDDDMLAHQSTREAPRIIRYAAFESLGWVATPFLNIYSPGNGVCYDPSSGAFRVHLQVLPENGQYVEKKERFRIFGVPRRPRHIIVNRGCDQTHADEKIVEHVVLYDFSTILDLRDRQSFLMVSSWHGLALRLSYDDISSPFLGPENGLYRLEGAALEEWQRDIAGPGHMDPATLNRFFATHAIPEKLPE